MKLLYEARKSRHKTRQHAMMEKSGRSNSVKCEKASAKQHAIMVKENKSNLKCERASAK